MAGVAFAKMDINIFTQIGFVVLVGLALQERDSDRRVRQATARRRVDRREATLEACRLRLRPIVMTSFAFILGVRAAGAWPTAPGPRCGGRWEPPCSAACWA